MEETCSLLRGQGWVPSAPGSEGRAGSQRRPPPGFTRILAQICGWASSSESCSRKERGWICRNKTGGERKGPPQAFALGLPGAPFPKGCVGEGSSAGGLGDNDGLKSSVPPPLSLTSVPYLEGSAYPHHRTQAVAIVKEEKPILSLRDVAEADVYLWGRGQTGRGSGPQPQAQLSVTRELALFLPEDRSPQASLPAGGAEHLAQERGQVPGSAGRRRRPGCPRPRHMTHSH